MSEKLEYQLFPDRIVVTSGTAYVVYICMGGSGLSIATVSNREWIEGPDEIIGVFETEEEAHKYMDQYHAKAK